MLIFNVSVAQVEVRGNDTRGNGGRSYSGGYYLFLFLKVLKV